MIAGLTSEERIRCEYSLGAEVDGEAELAAAVETADGGDLGVGDSLREEQDHVLDVAAEVFGGEGIEAQGVGSREQVVPVVQRLYALCGVF